MRQAVGVLMGAASLACLSPAWAQSVAYRCLDGSRPTVHYEFGEATAHAVLVLRGVPRRLTYAAESDAENLVFRQGPLTLRLPQPEVKQAGQTDLSRTGPMFVSVQADETVGGRRMAVDRMIHKSCMPVRSAARPQAMPVDPSTGKPLVPGYTAFGPEFRAVVSGGILALELAPHPTRRVRVNTERVGGGTRFTGASGLGLTLTPRPCRSDDGQRHPMTAVLRHGRQLLHGCAVDGAYGIAPT